MKTILHLILTLAIAGLATTALNAADKKEAKGNAAEKTKGKPGQGGLEREFQDLLMNCDKDNDGAVSKDEFTKNQPPGKDAAKVAEWFAKKDANKDDKLTRDEFAPPPGKK